MGYFAYWKARKDTIQLINELKNDLPTSIELLGKAMWKSVKGGIGATASAESRLDQGLARRMTDDFLSSQSPWAKMLLDYGKESIPYLKEHPELITQLLPMVQQFFGQKGGQRLNNSEPYLGLR